MRQEPADPQKTGLPPPNGHQSKEAPDDVNQDQEHQEDHDHKTAEERRAQAEQLQASIADQVDQLRNSEQWVRFLQFAGSFHHYS